MNESLQDILQSVAAGEMSVDEAMEQAGHLNAQPLGYATLDHHRHRRCGVPEVVFGAGKSARQIVEIAAALVEKSGYALITRAGEDGRAAVAEAFDDVRASERGGTLLVGTAPQAEGDAVPIVTAGTSDQGVAEEAELTCLAMGQAAKRISDVGVAGLHRLVQRLGDLDGARVVICIAGMEGALPSVVGGLVRVPVIAVPTSVGYGASFNGIAALLGMLTSCAAGVSVVNIDNGFGAAYIATLVQRQSRQGD